MLDQYIEHDMAAGDVTDELVASWSTSTPLAVNGPFVRKVSISVAGPTFGYTLFFAPAAGAAADDIVIVGSRSAIDVTFVNPSGAITVANANLNCDMRVPRNGVLATPMTLRISTSGKAGAGTVRVTWSWGDPL